MVVFKFKLFFFYLKFKKKMINFFQIGLVFIWVCKAKALIGNVIMCFVFKLKTTEFSSFILFIPIFNLCFFLAALFSSPLSSWIPNGSVVLPLLCSQPIEEFIFLVFPQELYKKWLSSSSRNILLQVLGAMFCVKLQKKNMIFFSYFIYLITFCTVFS